MSEYLYHTLNNGIRLIFKPNNSAVTHAGVYINVGSRDERGSDEGMAHFIEHSIFKGTSHRRSYHILNRIDGIGGELNAFTTKEETCLYASAPSQYLSRSLELFADILFCSTFPEREIEKEKTVVLEEINSYKDTPSELIFDDFEELILAGHPLAHNILGTAKNVRRFSSERIRQFFGQYYTPDRMVVSVVGRTTMPTLVRMCQHYFGDVDARPSEKRQVSVPDYKVFDTELHKHTHQLHVMTGCQAPDMFDDSKTAFSLLNNIIGGPAMNSRLNVSIREKQGFCYSVESQYTPFTDAGLFYIYAGIESGELEHYRALVARELRHLCDVPLSTTQLRAAKKQYIGQMMLNNEMALNEMQSIGKSFLSYDRVDTLDEMVREVEAVTSSQLRDIANQYLDPARLSTLVYG